MVPTSEDLFCCSILATYTRFKNDTTERGRTTRYGLSTSNKTVEQKVFQQVQAESLPNTIAQAFWLDYETHRNSKCRLVVYPELAQHHYSNIQIVTFQGLMIMSSVVSSKNLKLKFKGFQEFCIKSHGHLGVNKAYLLKKRSRGGGGR